jgi:hypothetical protein
VKDEPVIESDLRQSQEILDMTGRHFRQKLEPNGAFAGRQLGGVFFSGEIQSFLGLFDFGFDIAGQDARSFPWFESMLGGHRRRRF